MPKQSYNCRAYIPVLFKWFPYPHLHNTFCDIYPGKQNIPNSLCFPTFLDAANHTVDWGCDVWTTCHQHVLPVHLLDNSAGYGIITVKWKDYIRLIYNNIYD